MSESYPGPLHLMSLLTETAARQAISSMGLVQGSKDLDAGCGIGTHALWLAEETGPYGEVIGVDISSENLEHGIQAAQDKGLSHRVRFLREDLQNLPFPAHSLDYVWCADTLWPTSEMNPPKAIEEFRRVTRPGGQIGILFWSTQILLPGYPLLEARLNLAHTHLNPYLQDVPPALHFLRAPGWLRSGGLIDINAKSFLAEISAPLSQEKREAIACCMNMFWGDLESCMSTKDWLLFQNLGDPQSSDCLYDHPDYHALIVYTFYFGTVP